MQELWSQGREYERWPGTNINMVKIHTHVWHREVSLPTFLLAEKKKADVWQCRRKPAIKSGDPGLKGFSVKRLTSSSQKVEHHFQQEC